MLRQEKKLEQTILNLQRKANLLRSGKKFGTVRYPILFRSKVIDLMERGMPQGKIVQQLGISPTTIEIWKKKAARNRSKPKPTVGTTVRELFLVPDELTQRSDTVKIQMGKISIEAPASILRGDLLRELVVVGAL